MASLAVRPPQYQPETGRDRKWSEQTGSGQNRHDVSMVTSPSWTHLCSSGPSWPRRCGSRLSPQPSRCRRPACRSRCCLWTRRTGRSLDTNAVSPDQACRSDMDRVCSRRAGPNSDPDSDPVLPVLETNQVLQTESGSVVVTSFIDAERTADTTTTSILITVLLLFLCFCLFVCLFLFVCCLLPDVHNKVCLQIKTHMTSLTVNLSLQNNTH